jgi:hypothetical protein
MSDQPKVDPQPFESHKEPRMEIKMATREKDEVSLRFNMCIINEKLLCSIDNAASEITGLFTSIRREWVFWAAQSFKCERKMGIMEILHLERCFGCSC